MNLGDGAHYRRRSSCKGVIQMNRQVVNVVVFADALWMVTRPIEELVRTRTVTFRSHG